MKLITPVYTDILKKPELNKLWLLLRHELFFLVNLIVKENKKILIHMF